MRKYWGKQSRLGQNTDTDRLGSGTKQKHKSKSEALGRSISTTRRRKSRRRRRIHILDFIVVRYGWQCCRTRNISSDHVKPITQFMSKLLPPCWQTMQHAPARACDAVACLCIATVHPCLRPVCLRLTLSSVLTNSNFPKKPFSKPEHYITKDVWHIHIETSQQETNTPGTRGWSWLRDRTLAVPKARAKSFFS